MFLEPFEGPYLKLGRAGHHLADLCTEIDDYRQRVIPRFEKTERTRNPWEFRLSEPVPASISLIVSDIAHSLRSALDVMTCDIALIRDVGLSDMSYPFAESESAFLAELAKTENRKKFLKLGDDIVAMIAASKPYKGADSAIRYLHDINNQDKHRMLVPVAGMSLVAPSFGGEFSDPNSPYYRPDVNIVTCTDMMIAIYPDEQLQDDYPGWDPHYSFDLNTNGLKVLFPAGYVASGEVQPFMANLVNTVFELVESFRAVVIGT